MSSRNLKGNIAKLINISIKPIITMTTLIGGVWFSLWLKGDVQLSEASFMTLLTFSLIFSIILPNINILKYASLAKLEITLQEVKATETSVKELAALTLSTIEASRSHSLILNTGEEDPFPEAAKKLRKLINT